MGDNLQFRPNRMIAPLMATAVILLLGTAFCVAIILAFGEARPVPIGIAIGSAVGFAVLMWSLRDKPEARKRRWFAWLTRRPGDDERKFYRVAALQRRLEYGKNKPPTLEQLRELKDPTRTWVPAKDRREDGRQEGPAP